MQRSLVALVAAILVTGAAQARERHPAQHLSDWIDVAPAPMPDRLPLAGPEDLDADGYPLQYVDRPALRSLLAARRYDDLTQAFELFQGAFERDFHHETWMRDAVEAIGLPNPREHALIEEWIRRNPRSFAPYLARAHYWLEEAFVQRGGAMGRDTSAEEFAAMGRALEASRRDALRALKLRPRLVEPYLLLMKGDVARGDRRSARRRLAAGERQCPGCYELRAEWVGFALQAKWGGGGPGEAEAFAAGVRSPRYPRLRWLAGFADFLRADDVFAEDHAAGLAYIDRACGRGDDWRFLRERAALKRQSGDDAGRLADLNRAEAVRPGQPWVLIGRAWALADAERWEEAGRDLLRSLRSDPTGSQIGARLHPAIVQALEALADRSRRAGRQDEAARLAALVRDLSPDAAAAPAHQEDGGAPRARAAAQPGGGAPVTGNASPWIRLTVVDEAGRAIDRAGALAVTGNAPWDWLRRAVDGPRTRIGPDGTAQLPAMVGPATILVWGPEANGVVLHTAVEPTGADVRVALAYAERIAGRLVRPDRKPAAGMEVLAIPKGELGNEPRPFARTRSDADGAFTLQHLGTGAYLLFATSEEFSGPRSAPGAGQEAMAGQTVELEVGRRHVLRGRILALQDDGSKAPAERVRISAPPFGEKFLTVQEGRFTVGYDQAYAPLPVSFAVPGRPPVVRTVDLSAMESDAGDVVIGPGRTIAGLVTDPGGSPLEGAQVKRADGEVIAITKGDGSFAVGVQDGPVDLVVMHPRWSQAIRTVRADERDVRIAMSAGATIRVTGTDGAGALLGHVLFHAIHPRGNVVGCASDASATCQLGGLEPDEYTIYGEPPPGDPNRAAAAPLTVRVMQGSAQDVAFRWAARPARLAVEIRDAKGNVVPTGAYLFPGAPALRDAVAEDATPRRPYHTVPAGAALSGIAPGTYRLVTRGLWGIKECATVVISLGESEERVVVSRLDDGSCR